MFHRHKWHYLHYNFRICVECHEIEHSRNTHAPFKFYWYPIGQVWANKKDSELLVNFLRGCDDYGIRESEGGD